MSTTTKLIMLQAITEHYITEAGKLIEHESIMLGPSGEVYELTQSVLAEAERLVDEITSVLKTT